MATPQSPAWKNPRERMSKHLKRRSSRCFNTAITSVTFDDLDTESCPPMSGADAVVNPFKRSPESKRFKQNDENEEKDFSFDLDDTTANDPFSAMIPKMHLQVTKVKRTSLVRSKSMQSPLLDFSNMEDFLSPSTSSEQTKVPKREEKKSENIPVDLRLGTKLRITSRAPFPWMKSTNSTGVVPVRLTGNDRTEGMQHFLDFKGTEKMINTTNPLSLFESSSLYWQFPCFPWMSFYPRIDSLLKTLPKQSAPPLAPSMLDDLNREWTECFEQIFLSWKKGERKSFYVACASFTVLFTKTSGVDVQENVGEDSMSCFQCSDGTRHIAIITPTTFGFRRYLKSEGIDFQLCSWKKKRLSKVLKFDDSDTDELSLLDHSSESINKGSCDSFTEDKENNEKKNGSSDSDESPSKNKTGEDHDWLHEIGVSPRNTLKLRRHNSMTTATSNKNKEDTDEASSVLVTGSSVQTLYNFIQNERVCRSIAGPHANLPPTLIASQPFLYGQLKSLKKTSQIVKRAGHSMEYIAELEGGPIMFDNVLLAVNFIRSAGLCDNSAVQVRINDRVAYSGLNGIENSTEWTEITVKPNEIIWKS